MISGYEYHKAHDHEEIVPKPNHFCDVIIDLSIISIYEFIVLFY